MILTRNGKLFALSSSLSDLLFPSRHRAVCDDDPGLPVTGVYSPSHEDFPVYLSTSAFSLVPILSRTLSQEVSFTWTMVLPTFHESLFTAVLKNSSSSYWSRCTSPSLPELHPVVYSPPSQDAFCPPPLLSPPPLGVVCSRGMVKSPVQTQTFDIAR
jgi:hypothetical protein